jgi:predicted RNA-binding protein with PIN domain
MEQTNLLVGQIVFLKLQKGKIMPARVFEEIRRKTLQGETVSYVFQSRINGAMKTYEYDNSLELFRTTEEAYTRMLEEASSFIEKVCSEAGREAREIFQLQEESAVQQQSSKKSSAQVQQARIVLEDGTVANITI